MKEFFQKNRALVQRTLLTAGSGGAVLVVTAVAAGLSSIATTATVAFAFLAIITVSAFFGDLIVSVIVSCLAALCFDYYFLPPVGTLNVTSVGDWISLGAFLFISVVISKLTASATKTKEANTNLTNALGNLGTLGRWLIGSANEALTITAIAQQILEVFSFEYCSIHVYSCGKWDHAFGSAGQRLALPVEAQVPKIDQPLDWTLMVTENDLGVRFVPLKDREETFAVLAVKDDRALPETLTTLGHLVGARLAATGRPYLRL